MVIFLDFSSDGFRQSLRIQVLVLLKLNRSMYDHLHGPRTEQYRTPQQSAMGSDKGYRNDRSICVAGLQQAASLEGSHLLTPGPHSFRVDDIGHSGLDSLCSRAKNP